MSFESFFQDFRVGLRVLLKEKSFCFLAVLVLGLGIGGAITQFTVVNAIVLRGFSFPHPEQLVSVGLIDPKATDQNNNFGIGQIPAAATGKKDVNVPAETIFDFTFKSPVRIKL